MNKIEMGKQYRTRDGRPVRVLCVDANHPTDKVVGLIPEPTGELATSWDEFGRFDDRPDNWDLIEVRPRIKRTVWINLYHNVSCIHNELKEAQMHANPDTIIARVQVDIDVEEGHGLT